MSNIYFNFTEPDANKQLMLNYCNSNPYPKLTLLEKKTAQITAQQYQQNQNKHH